MSGSVPQFKTLQKRADFVRVRDAHKKCVTDSFIMQIHNRARDDKNAAEVPQVGITATKKIGNAVARNRAKRRLRALARRHLIVYAQPAHDYVLIARKAVLDYPFSQMVEDLKTCFEK